MIEQDIMEIKYEIKRLIDKFDKLLIVMAEKKER